MNIDKISRHRLIAPVHLAGFLRLWTEKEENVDASGISGLLSGLKGQAGGSGIIGIVSNLLDSDDDGSIIDDVGGLLKGFFKK